MLKTCLFVLFFISPFIHAIQSTDFYIALNTNNTHILQQRLLDISDYKSPNYGKYLTLDDIKVLASPTDNTKQYVLNWLNDSNISVINDYGDSIHCKANLDNIDSAFNTKLYPVDSEKNIYRSVKDYKIPSDLDDIILFVEGLSDKHYFRRTIKSMNISHGVDNNYSGKEVIDKAYNITLSNKTSYSTTSVCSIEYQENNGFSSADLQQAESLNSVPNNSVDNIIGRNTGSDTESQLDIQMMAINVPGGDLWFWTNNNWLYSMAVNMVYSKSIPDIVSMSWGWAEDEQCTIAVCSDDDSTQYIDRVNIEYIKLGLRGVTIIASSGDAGAPGRTNEDCSDTQRTVNAVYPGASPYVTSVGATYFIDNKQKEITNWQTPLCKKYGCAIGEEEFIANFNDTGWTSGGGISNMTTRSKHAKWQDNVATNYINSGVPLPINFNSNGRVYPDVSLIGHYCPIVDGGQIEGVDGTSCSSPIFASLIALLNSHQQSKGKSKLGFINPILYNMANDNPLIFNDITEGSNWCTEQGCCDVRADGGSDFGYKASKGYDPVYGLGTPNIGLMIEWLDKNT